METVNQIVNTHRAPEATVTDGSIAQAKLEKIIADGQGKAAAVIEAIMNDVPQDVLSPAPALTFAVTDDGTRVQLRLPDGTRGMHRHALGQAAERINMPTSWMNHLSEETGGWGRQLLAHSLTEGWKHREGKVLVRSVRGEARGIVSDRFRRLDSRPIVEALAAAAQERGLVPVDGYALDVRNALKMVLPRLYWVTPTEPTLVGLSWGNSDYGAGKHWLSMFFMRLACINGAISTNVLSEIHLGRQLTDAVFTQRTYELDTQTSVSAVRDVVQGYLSEGKIEEILGNLRRANETKLSAQQVDGLLRTRDLTKTDREEVKKVYTSADIEQVPAGASVYRLSNAISWVANQQADRGKKLDMMRMAGEVMETGRAPVTAAV